MRRFVRSTSSVEDVPGRGIGRGFSLPFGEGMEAFLSVLGGISEVDGEDEVGFEGSEFRRAMRTMR